MSRNTSNQTRTETQTVDIDSLEAGAVVSLTYDGCRGSRTISTYVVDVERETYAYSGDYSGHTITLGDTDARPARFLRISVDAETGEYNVAENYDLVRSLNSKSDRGQRLGRLLEFDVTEETDDRGKYVNVVRNAEVGDILLVDDRRAVVTHNEFDVTVEYGDGETTQLRTSADNGAYRLDDDYDRQQLEVESTEETIEPDEDAVEIFENLRSHGAGDDESKVETVVVDGDAYDIVFRHEADEKGIQLEPAGEEVERLYNYNKIRIDPLGLSIDDQRFDPSDIELITEDQQDAIEAVHDASDLAADFADCEDTESVQIEYRDEFTQVVYVTVQTREKENYQDTLDIGALYDLAEEYGVKFEYYGGPKHHEATIYVTDYADESDQDQPEDSDEQEVRTDGGPDREEYTVEDSEKIDGIPVVFSNRMTAYEFDRFRDRARTLLEELDREKVDRLTAYGNQGRVGAVLNPGSDPLNNGVILSRVDGFRVEAVRPNGYDSVYVRFQDLDVVEQIEQIKNEQ